LVFGHTFEDKKIHTYKNGNPLYHSEELAKLWEYGFNTIGDVTEASAMYQAQYMEKDVKNGNTGDRKCKSNHSGLGKQYFLRNYRQLLQLGYVPFNGFKYPIPRYFYKLAHRHWCHFNDPSYFHNLPDRKKVYSKLSDQEANKEISDLFDQYKKRKEIAIKRMERKWKDEIDKHLETGQEPEFVYSLENTHHNIKQKDKQEKF